MLWVEFLLLFTPRAAIGSGSFPRAKQVLARRSTNMRKEYDFSRGKRGAVVPSPGKTRITIMLDNEVLEYFRERADSLGTGYQTMIDRKSVVSGKSVSVSVDLGGLRILKKKIKTNPKF